MAGLTDNGLVIRTQPELQEGLDETVRGANPGIDLDEGPEQQMIGALSEQLAEAWETLAAVNAGFSRSGANGIQLDAVGDLTGSRRREPTRSRVTVTLELEAATSVPAGAIIAVDGDPDAEFITLTDAMNAEMTTEDVDVDAEAIATGPVAAPAGTLTVIVNAVSGWLSVTNAEDAELGQDRAEDPEYRQSSADELEGPGTTTIGAIRAAVLKVENVLEARVYQNSSDVVDGDGRPPHSIEVVVWDGDPAGADDDVIAQAILSKIGDGIQSHGDGEFGTATDERGLPVQVFFTRATELTPAVVMTVELKPGTGSGWEAQVAERLVERGAKYLVGEIAYALQLVAPVEDRHDATGAPTGVAGVIAVITVTIGGAALVTPTYKQIVRIDSGGVTVTEV